MRLKLLFISIALFVVSLCANAQDVIFWSGSSANGEWDWGSGCTSAAGGNWWWTTSGTGARQRPDCYASFNIIKFDNGINTAMNLNSGSDFSANQILFLNGTTDRTISTNASRSIYFQDNNNFGTNHCKIENYVAGTTHTFNVPIFVNSGENNENNMEINPVNGYLLFNNSIRNNSDNPINVYGAQQVTFSGDIAGTPGVTINNTATVVYSGTSKTYSGTTTINTGAKLKINSNQTLGNIALNGGTLQVDAGVTLTVTGTYSSTGGTIDNKGTIKFAGGSVTFPGSATVNNGVANTLTSIEVATSATVILSSSFNVAGIFTVSAGGILEFNGFNILGSGKFTLATTGTLKITSAEGVNADGNTTGNILCAGDRTYSQTGYYHYVGSSSPQFTGTAMTSGSTAKQIVINKTNTTDIVTLTQSTGTTGFLQISKGIFVESATSGVNGSGDLIIYTDGTYKIALTENTLPQISGTYILSGNATIELNGAGTQELRGSRSYRNLTFSNSGTKTLSSAITGPNTITGTVTIKDAAILDVENKSFGGSGTNLTMTGTSEYKTAGTGTKPDAEGTYTLGTGTKVTFTSGSISTPISTLQSIRISSPTVNYYNVDIAGNNVGTTATGTTGVNLKMQANGTFTVKSTGLFKHSNTAGFSGVANAAISNTNSPIITLEAGSTIEYAGANQTITTLPFPTPYSANTTTYSNLKISGTGDKKLPNVEVLVNNDLEVVKKTITEYTYLKIEADKLLTVANKITAPIDLFDEYIVIYNNGSLVQINNGITNDGNINLERMTTSIINTDYTYWSSPVSPQTLNDLSPDTLDGMLYSFDSTINPDGDWKQEISSKNMDAGIGYIVRGPEATGLPVGPAPYLATFVGKPNNGAYPISSIVADKSYLLGNPYPSALDADKFLIANSGVLDGTLYFWTHNTEIQDASNIIGLDEFGNPKAGSGVYAYTSDDYASYNITGGVGTAPAPNGTLVGNNNNIPSGYIASGQGFFATSNATIIGSNEIVFNNSMRVRTIAKNNQFFRTTNTTKSTTIEKHRIWLNLTNTQGAFKQTLVGYITDATNEYDSRFDGESFDANEFVDFYSLNQDKNLVIQGRALPFNENDEVPLGFRTTITGPFTINIDQVDGALTNQAVFIEDKLTNTVFDLKTGNYTFNTVAGTFNERFILRYTNKTLSNKDFDTLENQFLVSNKNKQLKVNVTKETIDKVTIYDLLGRQLFKKDKVDSNELTIPNLVSSQQTLLVKVSLQNGQTVTKKIIY